MTYLPRSLPLAVVVSLVPAVFLAWQLSLTKRRLIDPKRLWIPEINGSSPSIPV